MVSILTRLARIGRKADHLHLTVYTRKDCCCCHKAINVLKERQRRHRFALDEVDIDTDPGLAAEHGSSVPVVSIDGKVRFRGVVNPVLLDRFLEAESRNR